MPLLNHEQRGHPTQRYREEIWILSSRHIRIGGDPGINDTISQQLERPVTFHEIKVSSHPAPWRHWTQERARPVLGIQSKLFMISPPDKLMNMTLKVQQRQVSTQVPLRISPHKRNAEHIGASPAISTHIGLIKIDSCRHPAARAQPDQTVQGGERFDPYHEAAPNSVISS